VRGLGERRGCGPDRQRHPRVHATLGWWACPPGGAGAFEKRKSADGEAVKNEDEAPNALTLSYSTTATGKSLRLKCSFPARDAHCQNVHGRGAGGQGRGSATFNLHLLHDEEQSFDGDGKIRGVDMQRQQVRVSLVVDELDDVIDRNRSASSELESFWHFQPRGVDRVHQRTF
jgi:hypothetical protein